MPQEQTVVCEKVSITDLDNWYLVQYELPADAQAKRDCLAYLRDCGHVVICEPHEVVEDHDDEPACSWGDLCDILEPRDE